MAKVLVTVKTYPSISKKYDEIVCTAGFTENGNWIRIYPIPFRKLDYIHQYRKYDWIEVDLVRNTSDFRPETYRITNLDVDCPISVVGHLDTKRNWSKRKEIVLSKVYNNLQTLIGEAKNKETCTSLAVFKPTEVLDFAYEEVKREWSAKKQEQLKQMNLFEDKSNFKVIKKLPYRFSFVFKDSQAKQSKLMIEDWETGALYWNMLRKLGDEKAACQAVKQKYFDDFAKTKDLHFFMGTTRVNHFTGRNPFVIIGTFHPKIERNLKMNF